MLPESENAFLTAVNPNLGIVHRVCHAYFAYDPLEREDAFQDIMVQLWKSYPHFKGQSKFSTWMYTVALNTAIARLRRTRRAPQVTELAESAAAAPDMEEQVGQQVAVQRLYAAINTLGDIDKAIILLHLEDYAYDEIAAITGLSRTNVSVRLVRIRRALKDQMRER